jgi:hypothetical protein
MLIIKSIPKVIVMKWTPNSSQNKKKTSYDKIIIGGFYYGK